MKHYLVASVIPTEPTVVFRRHPTIASTDIDISQPRMLYGLPQPESFSCNPLAAVPNTKPLRRHAGCTEKPHRAGESLYGRRLRDTCAPKGNHRQPSEVHVQRSMKGNAATNNVVSSVKRQLSVFALAVALIAPLLVVLVQTTEAAAVEQQGPVGVGSFRFEDYDDYPHDQALVDVKAALKTLFPAGSETDRIRHFFAEIGGTCIDSKQKDRQNTILCRYVHASTVQPFTDVYWLIYVKYGDDRATIDSIEVFKKVIAI